MAETGSEPETAGEQSGSDEERRRKFREALERKHAQQADQGAGRNASGPGTIHGSHGPAASRRSFRRKSGG